MEGEWKLSGNSRPQEVSMLLNSATLSGLSLPLTLRPPDGRLLCFKAATPN